jgi:SAM-dependent methyltransferase
MDVNTHNYYAQNPQGSRKITTDLLEIASHYVRKGSRVLEVGCGYGDFSMLLATQGCEVVATDPIQPMSFPPAIPFMQAAFPLPSDHALLQAPKFQSILCIATLMHIPDRTLLQSLQQFRELMSEGGHLVISTCRGGRKLDAESRDERGILYRERHPDEYALLLERLGFLVVQKQIAKPDSLERPGIVWDTLVAVNLGGALSKGVKHAVSLIHNDDKTATYKLALLRALIDIAQNQPHVAKWMPDGSVQVPYAHIITLWIHYYFPLIQKGIPQIQSGHLRFSESFNQALTVSQADYPESLLRQPHHITALRRDIQQTLHTGPVRYAKGIATGRLFEEYRDEGSKSWNGIVVPGELWKELSLIGHWIRDSLLMEWARISAGFASKNSGHRLAKISEYMPALFDLEAPARFTQVAARLYLADPELSCTWSGLSIPKGQLHIDHMIPFSQWHTNAWWNLQPVTSKANLEKSDALPSMRLLLECKSRIVHCWELAYRHDESAFETEIKRDFLGAGPKPSDWQDAVFCGLRDRMELIAAQRGLRRWEHRRTCNPD